MTSTISDAVIPIQDDYVVVNTPEAPSAIALKFVRDALNTTASFFKTFIVGEIKHNSNQEIPSSIRNRISFRKYCTNTVLMKYTEILNEKLAERTIQYHFTFPVERLNRNMFPLSEKSLTFFPIVLTNNLGFNHIVLLVVDKTKSKVVFYDSNGNNYDTLSSSYVIGNFVTLQELFEKLKAENSELSEFKLEEKPIKHQHDLHNCGFYVIKFIMDYLSGNKHCLTHEDAEESFRKELLTKGPDIFDPIINQCLKREEADKN